MNLFSVRELSAGYGKNTIINNLSFDLESGSMLGILGANGSGKTTLLKALCGILPHKGSCILDNICLEQLSPRKLAALCSYIPQRSGISIDISVLDVVLMGFNPKLGLLEHPDTSMKAKARQMLALVGLSGREETNYMHLSEGQKQLCILARTLVTDCRLLLLDEPESALDFRFRHEMLHILKNWTAQEKRAAIITLHDPSLALNCCDKLLILAKGTLLGTICPHTDPCDKMEEMLGMIYGKISLQRITNRSGQTQLVMLKEE